jgi:mycofactocin system glycosyltransferase
MEDSPGEEFPRVSVVIPVRNRPAGIRSCIDSLLALDYPRDRVEIIVVDDASTDETPSAVASYDRGSVRLLAQTQHRGQSECRNVGARAGTGDVVAFIDSDCIADSAWLRTLVRDLEDSNVVASGGSVREASPDGWLKRYESSVSPLHMGETSARVMPGSQVEFLPSCNVAVRKQVFLEVGGFDASLRFGEDVDLIWRLIERGEVRYRPAGVVWHEHRGRLGPFLLNRINYTTAQAVFLSRFPGNRRRVDAPAGMALGAAVAIGLAVIHPAFVAVVLVPALAEATAAVVSARGSGGPMGAAIRVLAGYASSAYRALSFAGRHYAIPAAAISVALAGAWRGWVFGLAVAGASVILPAIVEWFRRRPHLDLLRFVAAFVLDSLAVGMGTLAGCVRYRTLHPLALRIRLHLSARNLPATRSALPEPHLTESS